MCLLMRYEHDFSVCLVECSSLIIVLKILGHAEFLPSFICGFVVLRTNKIEICFFKNEHRDF